MVPQAYIVPGHAVTLATNRPRVPACLAMPSLPRCRAPRRCHHPAAGSQAQPRRQLGWQQPYQRWPLLVARAAGSDSDSDSGLSTGWGRQRGSSDLHDPSKVDGTTGATSTGATSTSATSTGATSRPPVGGVQEAPLQEAPPPDPSAARTSRQVERLRLSLLAALSSLDRGLAANAREAEDVDELCGRLEGLGGPVVLAPTHGTDEKLGANRLELLAGMWRLVYSSGFNSGSLGGRRPGPPAALFPTILGQVYQRIDPATAHLDNIVELLLNYGPPDMGLLGAGGEALGRGLAALGQQLGVRPDQVAAPLRGLLQPQTQRRDSPAVRLTLRHDYEVTSPATVRIVYEETYGELVGSDIFAQLPRLEAPSLPEPLRPPKFLRSATFELTFLDDSLRITRGDRRELRVYLRDTGAEAVGGGGAAAGGATALDYDD